MTIWFATGNTHKKQELAAILTEFSIKIPINGGFFGFDPKETGSTFLENSLLKAQALRRLLVEQGIHEPVIADDSGLCVDALGGRPGIYSARYAGRHSGRYSGQCSGPEGNSTGGGKKLQSPERNRLLLEELGDNPNRKARFVCAMVLLIDENRFICAQETLEGEIVGGENFARGESGFGYDPILYLPEWGRTVAELGEEEKNKISHRGKAARIIAKLLTDI
jgi:XTP/dITP diphosphohydrolase